MNQNHSKEIFSYLENAYKYLSDHEYMSPAVALYDDVGQNK